MSQAITFLGKVVIGGLAVYGAKRLLDDLKGDKSEPTYFGDSNSSNNDTSVSHITGTSLEFVEEEMSETPELIDTLISLIEEFYVKECIIPAAEFELSKHIVNDARIMLIDFMKQRHPGVLLGEPKPVGSGFDGTMVGAPDHFDFLFPVQLDSTQWELVNGMDTLQEISGYWLVKRINLDFYPMGSNLLDHTCLVGNYLTPKRIIKYIHQKIELGISAPFDKYIIQPMFGDILGLEVEYSSQAAPILIKLIPVITLQDTPVVVTRHELKGDSDTKFWMQLCDNPKENLLQSLDAADEGCRTKCLKIVKTIAKIEHKTLGQLNSAIFKNIIMLNFILDKHQWDQLQLSDRVLDVFDRLQSYLESRCLPSYYDENVNLFHGYTNESLHQVLTFVMTINNGEGLYSMLWGYLDKDKISTSTEFD